MHSVLSLPIIKTAKEILIFPIDFQRLIHYN